MKIAHSRIRSLSLLLLLTACTAPTEPETLTQEAPEPVVLTPLELAEWTPETIPLPPGFAPGLPSGSETLRFAPGWRDPEAEGFWSYVFVMQIDESAPDAERIDDILELYYDGLIAAVAKEDVGDDPAQAEVKRTAPNAFEAQVQFPDAFGDLRPIDLRMVIDVVDSSETSTTLHILASPHPSDHAMWRTLAAVVSTMEIP